MTLNKSICFRSWEEGLVEGRGRGLFARSPLSFDIDIRQHCHLTIICSTRFFAALLLMLIIFDLQAMSGSGRTFAEGEAFADDDNAPHSKDTC